MINYDNMKLIYESSDAPALSLELSHHDQFIGKNVASLFLEEMPKDIVILGSGLPFIVINELIPHGIKRVICVDSRQFVIDHSDKVTNLFDLDVEFVKRDINWANDIKSLCNGRTVIIPNSEYLYTINELDIFDHGQYGIVVNECSGELRNVRKVNWCLTPDELCDQLQFQQYFHTSKQKFDNKQFIFVSGQK